MGHFPKNDAEAISEISSWLSSKLEDGRPPTSAKIVYKKIIPFGETKNTCAFLVEYKRKDNSKSIGFTGPFTWSFANIDLLDYEKIPKKERFQRILNLYFGWYYAFTYSTKRSTKSEINLMMNLVTEAIIDDDIDEAFVNCKLQWSNSCKIGSSIYALFSVVKSTKKKVTESDSGWSREGSFVFAEYSISPRGKGRLKKFNWFEPSRKIYQALPFYHTLGTRLGPYQFQNRFGNFNY